MIFLHLREAYAYRILVFFLGDQLCMDRGAGLRDAMPFASPCDLKLVDFVCRFEVGQDRLTIQIGINKKTLLHFSDELTHCRRLFQDGLWISHVDVDGPTRNICVVRKAWPEWHVWKGMIRKACKACIKYRIIASRHVC